MKSDQFYLFKDRRFLPIFLVQLCGCLNDSIIKNALIILITFKLSSDLVSSSYMLVMLANVLFILPFVLFASVAGQVADKYERSYVVRVVKFVEIWIVAASIYGFYNNNLYVLFSCLFLLGVHSTFFGPIKYSVLPDQLNKNELLAANGYVEAGTFLTILLGTMIGGFYNFSTDIVIFISICITTIGFISSFFMPKSNNYNKNLEIDLNLARSTFKIVKHASSKSQLYLSILGISWFWFIGTVIIAQIPSLTKDILKAGEGVSNLFLATFSIGVGVGSFWCSRIFSNNITTKYVFISSLGISLFGIDLFIATKIAQINYEPQQLKSVIEFLSRSHYWRILIDLFFLAAIGGIYVVPLYALMQFYSSPAHRSRIIAANNLINSFFMAGSTVVISFLFYLNFSIPGIILLVSIMNLIVAIYSYQLIPHSEIGSYRFWQKIFSVVFSLMYKVKVRNIDNFHKAGDRAVIVANHLSYLDPALIAAYLPENIKFAINLHVAQKWWVRPFLKLVKTYPVDPNSPMAIKSLIQEVKQDKKIAIFPEGRTSTTGSLMKIYEGPGLIADKADAVVLPIRVEGPEFTLFSKIRNVLKGRFIFRRNITLTILPPVKLSEGLSKDIDAKKRRQHVVRQMSNIMTNMIFSSTYCKKTLFDSFIEKSHIFGKGAKVLEDVNGTATYRTVLMKSFILGELINKAHKNEDRIGLMLPNVIANVVCFMGIQAAGKTSVMINFTSGVGNIVSACETSKTNTIYTSKAFIKKAKLLECVNKVRDSGINIVFLEDLVKKVDFNLKIKAFMASIFPKDHYQRLCSNIDSSKTSVILFTSGTEGSPKAVALSHENIQSNIAQILSVVDFNAHDLSFNALPMFHCFGLTVTLTMFFNRVPTFLYPSPLDYKIIPELIYSLNATILFGTDTFLSNYAKYAHPYDFYSLRYVVAGAEKLKDRTRSMWMEKFGIRVFEGYGVTEGSPVISVNTPLSNKDGTVGKFLPGIVYALKPVEGIEKGGRLCIYGPNVMQGYITKNEPGVIEPTNVDGLGKGWYDTGDVVSVDGENYITILARAKRFAKIAGEMVSLPLVEDIASNVDGNYDNAVVAIDDSKKGERLILFSNNKNMSKEHLLAVCKKRNLSELYIPKTVIYIDYIPVLPTGKVDYKLLEKMANENNLQK